MVFSGGGPGLLLAMAVITKQSPEGTAFTLPLYHPVVAPAVDDAISTAKINLPTKSKKLETNSGVIMLGKTRLFLADPHHNISKLKGKKGPDALCKPNPGENHYD